MNWRWFFLAVVLINGRLLAQEPQYNDLTARQISVAFVVVDGVYNTELMAPFDVFQHTMFHAKPGMKVFVVAPDREPKTSFEGLKIVPDYSFAEAPAADVLVVPSAKNSMSTDLVSEALINYVAAAGKKASFVMSLCDGAFVLAKAGLLRERESTTFPADVARYREMFPELQVVEDVSFVHDGPAITSAGGAKSYDAALYLVELLYGARAARSIAAGLVIDWELDEVSHRRVQREGSGP